MKKITPLVIVFLISLNGILAQDITHSNSLTIKDDHSISCNTVGVTRANTFYRSFDLNDFGITSAYDITAVEFGIERLVATPIVGYPIKISIYTTDAPFPTGNLTLINEITENLQSQTLTLHSSSIAATIPANSEFVVAIAVASDVLTEGGAGLASFEIGSNDAGETAPSFIEAASCSLVTPKTFSLQGRPDINIVMNIVGTSATASVGDLELVSFNYYPNPVKDRLYMRAEETITNVSLFNLLGQKIKEINPTELAAELDLSSLAKGTYFVKAAVNDKMGSFKVVKD